jgi:hypothetical protein
MVLADGQRFCVCCRKPLPWVSKMTRRLVTEADANRNDWAGERNSDGSLWVDMCLQCQIARSDHEKRSQ